MPEDSEEATGSPFPDYYVATLKRLGARLRWFRRAIGMTQESLGDKADIDARLIQMVEAGKTNATIRTLARISHALGLSLEAVFGQPREENDLTITRFHGLKPAPARTRSNTPSSKRKRGPKGPTQRTRRKPK